MPADDSMRIGWQRAIHALPVQLGAMWIALVAAHASLLRLPYFWDEAGYYIPAAWDFFRTGSLIPISTLTNAHPPLPSVYLALAWKLFGFQPLITRLAALFAAALALVAVYRIARSCAHSKSVAAWTVALTAIYPIWFTQSCLAHADIFAATGTLWGLLFALRAISDETPSWSALGASALCFSAAALSKETSICVPLTLAAMQCVESLRADRAHRVRRGITASFFAFCVLPLAAWFAYHRWRTGFLFGNPEFLRYNAQSTMDPLRVLAAFAHRVLHLSAHMNLFVLVLLALGALLLRPRESAEQVVPIDVKTSRRIWILLLSNAIFFSLLGGALLTRYLLPMYPLVILLSLTTLARRVRHWQWLAVVCACAFVIALVTNPPYGFAPEDNLAYAQQIRLQQAGIAQLQARMKDATVLTAWPLSDALSKPELGYVDRAFPVVPIDDFSSAQIARAASESSRYSAALVFSTKFDPQSKLFTLGGKSRALDEQFFGLHQDLKPQEIARRLGGEVLWEQADQGGWVALVRFPRALSAKSESTQ